MRPKVVAKSSYNLNCEATKTQFELGERPLYTLTALADDVTVARDSKSLVETIDLCHSCYCSRRCQLLSSIATCRHRLRSSPGSPLRAVSHDPPLGCCSFG